VRRHADPQAVPAGARGSAPSTAARHAAWEEAGGEAGERLGRSARWASRCIGELVDDTTVVNEYPLDRRFAPFTRRGSYFGSPHSSGLGFGLAPRSA